VPTYEPDTRWPQHELLAGVAGGLIRRRFPTAARVLLNLWPCRHSNGLHPPILTTVLDQHDQPLWTVDPTDYRPQRLPVERIEQILAVAALCGGQCRWRTTDAGRDTVIVELPDRAPRMPFRSRGFSIHS
jgi:hypothetical protein